MARDKKPNVQIVNNTQTNPISGRNIGYKLVPMPSQLMLAHPDSVGHARAEL
jgi:primary-amine oxidase